MSHWKGNEPYVRCERCKTSRPPLALEFTKSGLVCFDVAWCSEQAKRLGLILEEAFASPIDQSTSANAGDADVEKPPPPIPSPSTPDLGGES